jgi:hypothetical protein
MIATVSPLLIDQYRLLSQSTFSGGYGSLPSAKILPVTLLNVKVLLSATKFKEKSFTF